jgi:hypothetical protein
MPSGFLFSIIAAPAISMMYKIKYPMTSSCDEEKIDYGTIA